VVFKYEGDFIIQEVDSRSTGETVCDYQYGTETAGYTVSGTVGYTATYTLDPQGYPRELLITNVATASAEWPVRYTYRYEGCVMMDRIAYKADGSESGSTLHYTYDGVGHMVRQVSTDGRTDTTFEYSCWAH
jgi:YD repeat-containing protein